MKILYVSNLCSEKVFKYVFDTSINKPEQADQKFHGLLTKGLGKLNNKCTIETVSSIPVIPSNHKRKLWYVKSEVFNNIKYTYIPFINIPVVKNLGVFLYTFFKVFFWSLFNIGKKRMVVCDALYVTIATASSLACKLTFTKNVTIVMDLPGLMVTNIRKDTKITSLVYRKIISWVLIRFDGYILLTQQMNPKVNPKNKPYIIMEGLVDSGMRGRINNLEKKADELIVIYAGGLYEKYGVKTLIDAFTMLNNSNARLHIYGSGEMVANMHKYTNKDSRIMYKGIVPNAVVVEDQLKATLLVNPRPTKEEFTKYSFPSKNMEYMVSGTPTATTKLAGMPIEYHDFVFLFNDETVEGMHKTLENVLNTNRDELHKFGEQAKQFVIKNKNNEKQAERVLEFYNSKLKK